MPVIAERITQPSKQDLIDLDKTCEGDKQWLHDALASGDWLIGGRFNDRLVAAFLLKNAENHWQLQHLQVRAITRRRGVARQTLRSALTTLPLERPVSVNLSEHPWLESLFVELGFTQVPESPGTLEWRK